MRTVTTASGTSLELDGDVLAVLEIVSRDLAREKELDYGYEDVDRQFEHLVAQMTEQELRRYLKESLFMSFNRYENDRIAAILTRASRAIDRGDDSDGRI
jgi:hypothetical protein